jgi:protein-S-isoprenylcysteine O-methyltransferase Ste14
MKKKETFNILKFTEEKKIVIGYAAAIFFLLVSGPTKGSVFFGIIFCIIGEAVRTLSIGEAYNKDNLITTGIYGYVRNPLYVGTFLIGTGIFIMGNVFIFTVAFIPIFWVTYNERIKEEEVKLKERFKEEFDEYALNVPCLLPRFTPWKKGKINFEADFIKLNKEYWVWLGIYAVTILMFLKV